MRKRTIGSNAARALKNSRYQKIFQWITSKNRNALHGFKTGSSASLSQPTLRGQVLRRRASTVSFYSETRLAVNRLPVGIKLLQVQNAISVYFSGLPPTSDLRYRKTKLRDKHPKPLATLQRVLSEGRQLVFIRAARAVR